MGLRDESCVVLTCDDCGRELDFDEGVPIHFATSAEAYQAATESEWVILGASGERAMCPRCVERAGCDRVGHQWQDWTPALGRDVAGPSWWRYCTHCGAVDHRAFPGGPSRGPSHGQVT